MPFSSGAAGSATSSARGKSSGSPIWRLLPAIRKSSRIAKGRNNRSLRRGNLDIRPAMFDWFHKKQAPLTGAPKVRRQKTYSAESGYVYQYFYEGQRPAKRDGSAGTEFVFNMSADRKSSSPVSVFLSDQAIEGWQGEHGREVSSPEGYAGAKLALFHGV